MGGSKRKILLIGGTGVLSGVPRHLWHVVHALRDVADVTCIAEETGGAYQTVKDANVCFVRMAALRVRLNPILALQAARALRRALNENPADLVWVHARMPVILVRLLLALGLWRPKGQVAITYHGLPTDPGHRRLLRLLSFWIEKTLLRLGPNVRIVLLTDEMKQRFARGLNLKHLDRHNIHILPNCSDLNVPAFAVPEKPKNEVSLIMTSRACHQKNLPLALRFFKHLPSNYRLTMLGDGTDAPKLQQTAQRILSPDAFARLTLVGPVANVAPYLSRADCFLLTSRYEGLSIGALEAMQMGLPIVLNQFEGAKDLVTGNPSALVCDFQDLERSAMRVTQFIDQHRSQHNEKVTAIKAFWSRRWSPDVFAANCQNVIAEMIADTGP